MLAHSLKYKVFGYHIIKIHNKENKHFSDTFQKANRHADLLGHPIVKARVSETVVTCQIMFFVSCGSKRSHFFMGGAAVHIGAVVDDKKKEG